MSLVMRALNSKPGKNLSLLSKAISIANLLMGEAFIGFGWWGNIGVWGVIEVSIALAVLSLPVDISIILKNMGVLRSQKGSQG
jgi:hypothetical protein